MRLSLLKKKKLVYMIQCRKFSCQKCASLWSTNHWKNRLNHGKKIEQDRYISSHDIGKELDVDHKTVLNHLKNSRYRNKLDVCIAT